MSFQDVNNKFFKMVMKKKAAFTLTEVLLAVLIVGIIAAMVLPAIITKYQNKVLGSAFDREIHSIQDSINSLVAVENNQLFLKHRLLLILKLI